MKTFLIIASIILTITFTACQSTDQTENKTMSNDTMVLHSDSAMQHQQP